METVGMLCSKILSRELLFKILKIFSRGGRAPLALVSQSRPGDISHQGKKPVSSEVKLANNTVTFLNRLAWPELKGHTRQPPQCLETKQ